MVYLTSISFFFSSCAVVLFLHCWVWSLHWEWSSESVWCRVALLSCWDEACDWRDPQQWALHLRFQVCGGHQNTVYCDIIPKEIFCHTHHWCSKDGAQVRRYIDNVVPAALHVKHSWWPSVQGKSTLNYCSYCIYRDGAIIMDSRVLPHNYRLNMS